MISSCLTSLMVDLEAGRAVLRTKPLGLGHTTKQHPEKLKVLPDTGSILVLMNKSVCVSKIESILADDSKFKRERQNKDQIESVEFRLTSCLRKLEDHGLLSEQELEALKLTGTVPPMLYGLPRSHKPDVPIRPIIDICDSPYHATASWLADKLKPIRHQIASHSLRETFEFV
ncbi:unnamed protein product [Dibothriocephalus latus]|uniref:Uncharacterized protein n=1 Tax=Dibothriocephalus latus TaxID=60516 RepID=A0A3P6TWL8_DIBLA|nr:unnamed protein product [Dibothriocephalus latus]